MLNIGIFLVMTGRQAGGPETYERCLVDSLSRVDSVNSYRTYSLDKSAPSLLPPVTERMHHKVFSTPLRAFSTSVSLPLAMRRDRIDLLHAPFTPPPFSPRPYVFTHHCFSTFNHPEFYAPDILLRLNALLKVGLRNAVRTICVSKCTLDLTADLFGLDRSRMEVVYNGVGKQYQPVERVAAAKRIASHYGIHTPYFLYVGKLESRKNIVRLLHAFARFRSQSNSECKLVLAGRRTSKSGGIDEAINELSLADHVIELGYVADADMPALYSAATCFLFPTLWEGFGIPVVEAMACATPVITSNLSALPEVSGGAALLVNPYNVDDIAEAMAKICTDAALRDQLVAFGLVNARRFDWDETARQTLKIYDEAAADQR